MGCTNRAFAAIYSFVFFTGWLSVTIPVFGASQVLQQFNAIASSDTFRASGVPPDPHGAVGPKGILASVNLGLEYYTKSTNHTTVWVAPLATNLVSSGTNAFWAPNAGYTSSFISDPKVVFDPATQRFFVIMQENTGSQAFLNIAVSRNSDPRSPSGSDWYFYRSEVTDTWSFPVVGDTKIGIDYPGVAVDSRALTVVFNAFALNQAKGLNGAENFGSRMFVFDKRKLIAGIRDAPRVWSNQAPFDLPLLENDSTTIMPAQPIGKSDPGNRIFAVQLHHEFPYLDGNWTIRLHVINDPLGTFSYQYDDVPIDSPNGDPGAAPQPASGPGVDTEALKPLSACYLDNKVWLAYTQKGDSGNSVVHWVAILPRTREFGGTILYLDGYIDAGPGVWTYMPTFSAGPFGDLCLTYTESSATELPSIYYQFRPTDSPWDPPIKLQASTFPTSDLDTNKNINRWGDYGAVAIDPVDSTFWVTQEYVNNSGNNSWKTFWAQIAACRWPIINFLAQPVLTNLCVPSTGFSIGVRSVAVDLYDTPVGPPEIDSYVWRRNGVPLPASDRFIVASNINGTISGGSLTILAPSYADEGFYDAKIVNACGDKYATFSDPMPLLLSPIPSWATIETDVRPLFRQNQTMVYDQALAACVLFGGIEYNPGHGWAAGNDTWLWDGQTWTSNSPALSPPPRANHSMAYDSQRQRVVLFGGYFNDGVNPAITYGDTWEWDGHNWQLMAAASTNTPPARRNGSMAYDPVRGETLLIGGDLINYQDRVTTWGWNGTNWTVHSTNLATRTIDAYLGPYDVDYGNAMAFDERRGVMVLFGAFLNSSYNLVMEWGGGDWTAVTPSGILPTNSASYQGVLDSRSYSAYYDSYRGMVACVGGGAYNTAIWYWDGSQFYSFDTQLDGVPVTTLSPYIGLAFDRQRRALVWSGGENFGPHRTREIRFADNPLIIQGPKPAAVETGQGLTLQAAVSGVGALRYQWLFNDNPLPANPRFTGTNTPTLTINPTQTSDSGLYSLVVNGQCSSVTSPSVRVNVGPILNLLTTATSYRMSWTATNVTVEQGPTVLGPWTSRSDLTSPFDLPVQQGGTQFFRLRVLGQ